MQEVDVHKGLDSTLVILKYKLKKKSIELTREYDESLPRIKAYGSELNLVWTNLDCQCGGGYARRGPAEGTHEERTD